MKVRACYLLAAGAVASSICSFCPAGGQSFAVEVISFDQGVNPHPGYASPESVLGSPARFTGVFFGFDAVVSAFNPPFDPGDIFSIGQGGHVTVRFDAPIVNDSNNPYGIDLLIFGNTGFIDDFYPGGIVGGMFGEDGGIVQVSSDGVTWHTVKGAQADHLMPTVGYVDSGPFDEVPGRVPSDFTRPVDPALTLGHVLGLNNSQLMQKYRGSGGGSAVDIASTGLAHASYVRVLNPIDSGVSVEIDAFSAVLPRLPGDVNFDGIVDVDDLLLLLSAWGAHAPGGPPADFNGDGLINVDDLLILLGGWS